MRLCRQEACVWMILAAYMTVRYISHAIRKLSVFFIVQSIYYVFIARTARE